MNILAEFKALKEKLAGFLADQTKATLATLTEFSTKLTNLETGAMSELSEANAAKLVLEQGKVSADAKVSELTGKLSEQNKTFLDATTMLREHMAKMDAAYATTGPKKDASLTDLITSEINATNTALAKTGVDISKLPASPATTGAASSAAPKKFKSVDEEIAYVKAQAAKV